MELLGLSWLVLLLDGSPLTLGAVMFCRGIPGLVVAPIGGVLADRLQRRGLVVTTQLGVGGLALGIAELSHSGDIKIVHLVLYALLVGGLMALNTPAVQALTYDSAGQDDLANAVILTQVAFGISRVLGPILGGLLIVSVGMDGCFALSGASNLVAGIVLLAWKGHPQGVAVFRSFSFQLSEGIHFLGANHLVLVLLVIEIVMELFALPYYTLMPLLARDVFVVDASGVGVQIAVAGAGGLLSMLVLAADGSVPRRGLILVVCGVLHGVSLMSISLSSSFGPSLVVLLLVGGSSAVVLTLINVLLQSLATDRLRGWVMGVYVLTFGLNPVGNIMAGAVAEYLGAPATLLAFGAAVAGCMALAARLAPRLLSR
jgi:MFS family permease